MKASILKGRNVLNLQVLIEDRKPDRIRFSDSPTDILFWLSLKKDDITELSSRNASAMDKSVRRLNCNVLKYSTCLSDFKGGRANVFVDLIFEKRPTCVFGHIHSHGDVHKNAEIKVTFRPEKEPDLIRTYPSDIDSYGSILAFWVYGNKSFITCFGNGNSSTCRLNPQTNEHSASYTSSNSDFALAHYNFKYRLPPLVYNTIQVRHGCILDTMPENYVSKIFLVKDLGVNYVVIHDHWFQDFGDWRPDYPEDMHNLIEAAQKIGLKVLLYWSPCYNVPHDERIDAKTFISAWNREKTPKTIRILDPKYDDAKKLMRHSLLSLISRYPEVDGIYIDLFWMWPGKDMTGYSFLDWQLAAEDCVKIIRDWKSNATILFDAIFASPPVLFYEGIPLFVDDPRLGILFGGGNTWMSIFTDPDFQPDKLDMGKIFNLRNKCMIYGSPPYIVDAMLNYPESYEYLRFLRDIPRDSIFYPPSAGIVHCSPGVKSATYVWNDHARIFLANMESKAITARVLLNLYQLRLEHVERAYTYSILTNETIKSQQMPLELSIKLNFKPYGYHVLEIQPKA